MENVIGSRATNLSPVVGDIDESQELNPFGTTELVEQGARKPARALSELVKQVDELKTGNRFYVREIGDFDRPVWEVVNSLTGICWASAHTEGEAKLVAQMLASGDIPQGIWEQFRVAEMPAIAPSRKELRSRGTVWTNYQGKPYSFSGNYLLAQARILLEFPDAIIAKAVKAQFDAWVLVGNSQMLGLLEIAFAPLSEIEREELDALARPHTLGEYLVFGVSSVAQRIAAKQEIENVLLGVVQARNRQQEIACQVLGTAAGLE